MKKVAYVFVALWAMVCLQGCTGSSELEQMIPSDAIGVMVVDVPAIVDNAGLQAEGKLSLPESLRQVLDESEGSALATVLTDLPRLGLDLDAKAYGFMTEKTYATVWIAALSDSEQARLTLSRGFGADFSEVDGLQCLYQGDYLCAISDDILMVGRFNRPVEKDKAVKAAKNILLKKNPKAIDDERLKEVLRSDVAFRARLNRLALQSALRRSAGYRKVVEKMPLIELFTQSDLEAVDLQMTLAAEKANLTLHIDAGEQSDYNKLLSMLLTQPSADVLKAIPNSMDYVLSMSVKGERLVNLPQVSMMLKSLDGMPYMNRLNLSGLLSLIDGSVAVAVGEDPHLKGEWNAVFSARTTASEQIIKQISLFASLLGQAPEVWNGEYIYQYDNKMIKLGTLDSGVLYGKMLDYDQPEASLYDMADIRKRFETCAVSFYARSKRGVLNFGLTDHFNGTGEFTAKEGGAALGLLETLCLIGGSNAYDDMFDQADELDSSVGVAIDQLHPME